MLTKLFLYILGCLLLSVTPLLGQAQINNDLLSGNHTARVIAPKAIVYSDELMNSPLGFISNDRYIVVGNPRKQNPNLVPLIISGRIAYIEVKNIKFESKEIEQINSKRGAPKEHDIDIILTKPEEKLSENNSVYFSIHKFSSGEETRKLIYAIDSSDTSTFTTFDATFIHRQQLKRFFWGAGFEYGTISTDSFSMYFTIIKPTFGLTLLKNPVFTFDLNLSIDISMSSQMNIKNNISREPSDFFIGPQLAARITFTPNKEYHLFGALGIRSYKVYGIKYVPDSTDTLINGINNLKGVDISAGIAMEL